MGRCEKRSHVGDFLGLPKALEGDRETSSPRQGCAFHINFLIQKTPRANQQLLMRGKPYDDTPQQKKTFLHHQQ